MIDRSKSKLWGSAKDAVADIQSGSTILSAGFGLCGVADTLIGAMRDRGPASLHSLTAISNNAGIEDVGGLALLTKSGQVEKLIISFLGNNKALEKQYLSGGIAIELCPQGTLAERIRAGGAGIPAFYTPTGVGTYLQEGKIPMLFSKEERGKVVRTGSPREAREFGGRKFLMETALTGDVAILRAWKADEAGNCVFRYTTKAFGPIMAKAARLTIVEAEHIVKTGELSPSEIHLPGIFVDRIVPCTAPKKLEMKNLRADPSPASPSLLHGVNPAPVSPAQDRRNRIARRVAKELKHGSYANLGIGIPTLAASFVPPETRVWLQSENGILGMGPYPTASQLDPDIINAGKETVTLLPGASIFDSAESFGMIRGGHVDVSILGALQVSASGDLANYMIPGSVFKGMGGAMDLVGNPDKTKVVVATEHVGKDGRSKIVQECDLPLTGARCVSLIITDLAVFEVDRVGGSGLRLVEVAEGVSVEEVRRKTEARFVVKERVRVMGQ